MDGAVETEVMYGMIEGHEVQIIEGGFWKDRLAIRSEVKIQNNFDGYRTNAK